jgi:hypothetical protein
MRNIVNHGPRFAALLLFLPAFAFMASLFWHIGQAPAQVQTYSYTGPAFNFSACLLSYGTSPPCVGSSIAGSVTFIMPAGYSGSLSTSKIIAYGFSAPGIGSVATGDYYNPSDAQTFYFTNGQLYNWDFDIYTNNPSLNPYTDIFSHYLGMSSNESAETTNSIG